MLDQARARLGSADPTVAIRLEEILQAAHDGRVDSVVVASDQCIWGRFRPGAVPDVRGRPDAIDDDLLNIAAALTLRHGGRAYALPTDSIPRRSPAIATFRF